MQKPTLGVIIGHRNIFSEELAKNGRKQILEILGNMGIDMVAISEEDNLNGLIENYNDAKICAELFRKNRDSIDGILVSLPNFGDERAICDTIKMSGLNVPVFVHAFPDESNKFGVYERRDGFCGKISTCNVLKQYGIAFTIGEQHTVALSSEAFKAELKQFVGICKVVKGIKNARIGCIGARMAPFKTVRYSEKILEHNGISIDTIDLSEIVVSVEKLVDSDKLVQAKLGKIKDYCHTDEVGDDSLVRMAKLSVVIDDWMANNGLNAFAMQCWPAMQETLRIFPCGIMSMMNDSLISAGCEADIAGAVGLYALHLAGGSPGALFDWNNNYSDDPDKMVFFHCSNTPKSMLGETRLSCNAIAAKFNDIENTYGCCVGRIKSGQFTFARVSTDDITGRMTSLVGEGEFTSDPLDSFGVVGVAKINRLQELLKWICRNGFEHHVALSHSNAADALQEAFGNYLGWQVYRHN